MEVSIRHPEGPTRPATLQLTANQEEAKTLYYALREYRTSLVNTLIDVARTQFDLDDYFNSNYEHVKVLNLNDNVALGWEKECDKYEDLMFLHEELYKVNKALFALINDTDMSADAVQQWLGVD